jgi:hypothetical protein
MCRSWHFVYMLDSFGLGISATAGFRFVYAQAIECYPLLVASCSAEIRRQPEQGLSVCHCACLRSVLLSTRLESLYFPHLVHPLELFEFRL